MSSPKWYITKVRPSDPGYGTFSADTWPWLLYYGRPASVIARRYGWMAFRAHEFALDYIDQPDAVECFCHRRSSINYVRVPSATTTAGHCRPATELG